jgi:hypothetical protein
MTFTALYISIVFNGTHNKLNHKKIVFFFQLAMDQMITFNTLLDSEKKTLPD